MSGKRAKQILPPTDATFSDLVQSGRLPSFHEMRLIHETLTKQKAHLAHLNSKVPRRGSGRKTPSSLRAELAATRHSIKTYSALISPWRRLPVELLAEVFTFAINYVSVDHVDDLWDGDRRDTLLLCKICKTWREVAISTPKLWTVLSLRLRGPTQSLDWIPLWLDRSRCLPLHLQVYWDHIVDVKDATTVLAFFAAHLHHTATLSINNFDTTPLHPPDAIFPPFHSLHAPLLTALETSNPSLTDSDWRWIRAVSQSSPRLAYVNTVQFSLDCFPVPQLTIFHILDPVPMADFIQLLRSAPGLRELSIDITGPVPTSGVLVMPALSTCQITSTEHLGEVFDLLQLPNLADIQIFHAPLWPHANFISLLTRSECSLRRLYFDEVDISGAKILACLQHKSCETLEDLGAWSFVFGGDELFRYLTYSEPPFPHPQLQHISLEKVYITDGPLADLAESRILPLSGLSPDISPPQRLRTFTIVADQIGRNDSTRLNNLPFFETDLDVSDWRSTYVSQPVH